MSNLNPIRRECSAATPVPARGETLEVTIEKVIFGGDGLARVSQGFVVFVPFAAKGDRVRVRLVEKKAHHARGEIVEIVQPGPARENPPCPYHGKCGGCQYQHLTYAEELRLKENQVREAFARVGKLPDAPILPIIASPNPYGYRNRITVHAESGSVGFRGVNGRDLIDIRECLLARPDVNAQLARLRGKRPADGHYSLRDATVPPSGFFQANHDLREAAARPDRARRCRKKARRCSRAIAAADFSRSRRPDDSSGCSRSITIRARCATRTGLDSPTSIGARGTPLSSCRRSCATSRKVPARRRRVLVDPPREGLPVRLAEALCGYPVAHVTYVSCDPATLARDARMLAKTYRLVSVQPVDLFPRTAQIECVSVWEKP